MSKGFVSQWDRCLGLWTEEGFADVASRLTEKIREGLAPQEAMRSFAANAHEVRPDSQGRIPIPQRLREFARLERDASSSAPSTASRSGTPAAGATSRPPPTTASSRR